MTIEQLQQIFSNYPPTTEVKLSQPPYIADIEEVKEYVEMNTNQIELVIKGED